MRTPRLTPLAWPLSAAMLLLTSARAMEIRQFDKMADRDQANYIQVLVDDAQKVLRDEGRSDLAGKMDQLFTEIFAGDKISLGMQEFEDNLALLRVNDAEHAQEKNPKDPRIEVEDVLFITLKKNHIDLPDSFFTVAKNFKPKYPLQKQ